MNVFIHLPGVVFLILTGVFLSTLNKLAKSNMHLKGTRASGRGSQAGIISDYYTRIH